MKLSPKEVTDLLVATSLIDDGTNSHVFLRDPAGNKVAVYVEGLDEEPLSKGTDWWAGPAILAVVVLVLIGAVTIARALIELLF